MSVLTNGLRIMSVAQEWQTVVTGVIIILAVYADILRRGRRPEPPLHEPATGRHPDHNDKETSHAEQKNPDPGRRPRRRCSACAAAAQAQETYIPLISKGFQHQFWQAVKAGADQAAKDFKRRRSPSKARRPRRRSTSRSTCCRPRWRRSPTAIGFAALDSQAAIPLLKKAQAAGIPVIAFDSGVDSDIPVTTATTDNVAAAGAGRRQDGRADRRAKARSPSSRTTRPAAPASTAATASSNR